MTRLFPFVVAVLAAITLLALPHARGLAMGTTDDPPVFDKRSYAEAKKAAEDSKKWFIVKATATWCGPCKKMDATTWRDEKVVTWLTDHAIVVAIDVDKEKKLAEGLSIEAMPTMIAFKEGKEFDRVIGYKPSDEFLGWLEGLAKGEKSIEAVKKRAGSRDAGKGNVDIRARLNLARSLAHTGKPVEAADEFVWLWEHMLEHDSGYYGVRLSFMVGDMQQLAAGHEDAKKKFTKLRDEASAALDGEKVDVDAVVDWVALNKVIGDNKATLTWYDKVKDQKRARPLVNRVSRELSELFIAEKRWADLGGLYPDPIAVLEQDQDFEKMMAKHAPPDEMDEVTRKQIEAMRKQSSQDKAGQAYAGLLAAGREADANKYAVKAREFDSTPAMTRTLVSWALTAKQPRQAQIDWLVSVPKDDAESSSLRGRVEAALKEEKGK